MLRFLHLVIETAKGFMKLAVHAIKVDAFVERMLQLAGLNTVE